MAVPRTFGRSRTVAVAMAATLVLIAVAPVSAVAPLYEPCDVQNAAVSYPGTAGQSANNDLDCYAVAIQGPDNTTPDYTPENPWAVRPLLSVGDQVPRTRNNAQSYQMVGIPDGLGIDKVRGNEAIIYMNHEFATAPFGGSGGLALTQAVIGEPQNRGAFVSTWVVDKDGRIASGDYAYDWVYTEDSSDGPIALVGNATRPFARFCSGTLAGKEFGFDRPIFFTNEEDGVPANTYDERGGLSVAIFDQEAHTLPKLGHMPKENTVPAPKTGNQTVLFALEDGGFNADGAPNSQLYMWVGDKQPRGSVLARNGLLNGTLYVFVADSDNVLPATYRTEADFLSGSISGRWHPLSDQTAGNQATLEAEAQAAQAFGFVRVEDGAFDPKDPSRFFFATTGDAAAASYNLLGRLYELAFDPKNPTADTTLTIRQNAQVEIAAGRDTALSPDNLDVADGVLMVNEDGTGASRPVMGGTIAVPGGRNRDGSIWRFNTSNFDDRSRIVELDPPSEDGVAVGPGVWETSGIAFAEDVFGHDSWIFDVQAHPPTTAPGIATLEDGQLLVLYRPGDDDDGEDD